MQFQTEISLLEQRLSSMEEQLDGIKSDIQDNNGKIGELDAKVSQILEALMGNPITNSKGLVGNLRNMRETVKNHDEMIKKFTWFWYGISAFAGVIISILVFLFKYLIK